MFKQFKRVISILSLLTAISIVTAMLQIPVFAVDEIVTENISNGQSEDDLYLYSDKEAVEIESEDEDTESEPNEDVDISDFQLDNQNMNITLNQENDYEAFIPIRIIPMMIYNLLLLQIQFMYG